MRILEGNQEINHRVSLIESLVINDQSCKNPTYPQICRYFKMWRNGVLDINTAISTFPKDKCSIIPLLLIINVVD